MRGHSDEMVNSHPSASRSDRWGKNSNGGLSGSLHTNDHSKICQDTRTRVQTAFPFQPRDRHGRRTRLSRPTCAPRATSSRVDNLFEPRREIHGGDPPRIPPTARSLPGCSRDPWIRHPAEGVRHPRQVGPDRPSARVTVSKPNANRVRVLPLARHRRHATLPRPQVRTRRRLTLPC